MNNIFILETEDTRFRPVTVDDAEFIVHLRNQKHAQGTIHDTSLDVEKQRQWIKNYLDRENEYYWIMEDINGNPFGTNSFYHYDAENGQIEQGRWVQVAGSDSVVSMSREIVLKDFAFYVLHVSKVVGDVVSTNKQVVKYNRFIGARETERTKIEGVGNESVDVIWFEMTEEMWRENRKKLLKFCNGDSEIKIFRFIKQNKEEILYQKYIKNQ